MTFQPLVFGQVLAQRLTLRCVVDLVNGCCMRLGFEGIYEGLSVGRPEVNPEISSAQMKTKPILHQPVPSI